MALKFAGGVLAFVTGISGLFAYLGMTSGVQSSAPMIFICGLVGMCVLVAIDSHGKASHPAGR